jgi:hypothetical protein
MKTFSVCFYRPPALGQIGPQAEYLELEAEFKRVAEGAAKSIARELGWRYRAIVEGAGGKMAFLRQGS